MNWKPIVATALILLLASAASAVYDPNGTHYNDSRESADGPRITATQSGSGSASSGSSASASTRVTEGGDGGTVEWQAEIAMVNRTQDTDLAGTITSVSQSEPADGTYRIEFTGYRQAPTPCHTLGHEIDGSDGEYTFTATLHEPEGMCAQVLTTVQYEAAFETDEPFNLTVKHGDETVDTLEFPTPNEGAPDDDPVDGPQEQSLLGGLITWFTSLF